MEDPLDVDPPGSLVNAGPFRWSSPRFVSAAKHLSLVRGRIDWRKIVLFGASLFLFILAIVLMKDGARGLGPLLRDGFAIDNAANCLGFGWLFAYVIMSGSPVAAAALTFFDAGAISRLDAFAMIIGSRFGASFIVLLLGFIYVLRGRNRSTSLSMGVLSLLVTASTYLVAMLIGAWVLQAGTLDGVRLPVGILLNSIFDLIFNPLASWLAGFLPGWSLFLVGLGIIILSFNLFDRCLPQMTVKESQVGRVSRLVYRPWVMFLLGATITMISMSVSVSLSILVPLSARGFVRRENVIPYIMGANITTFIDTLLAAVLLETPLAFTIILTGMVSITLVSIVILATFYRLYERTMLRSVTWVTARNRNLALFMASIFVIPLILMWL